MELTLKKAVKTNQADDDSLQSLLSGEKGQETKLTAEEVVSTEEAKDGGVPKVGKAPQKASKYVTFYTRRGDKYDSKTGKERPREKHVVTYAEWLRIKDRLPRLGYKLVNAEE